MATSNTLNKEHLVMEIRMILIGKTGCGKSSSGNTILGEELFKSQAGLSSGTEKCDFQHVTRNGYNIQVTDTPGVCDTHREADDVRQEISKSIATVTPGPHAVLMVIKANERFTKEEAQAYDELKELFGDGIKDFMIVVFTGMDKLKGKKLSLYLQNEKIPSKVKEIIAEANHRYIGFNNELPWEERTKQGDELLGLVREMHDRGHYNNDLVTKFHQVIAREAKHRQVPEVRVKEIFVFDEEESDEEDSDEEKSDEEESDEEESDEEKIYKPLPFHQELFRIPYETGLNDLCSVM